MMLDKNFTKALGNGLKDFFGYDDRTDQTSEARKVPDVSAKPVVENVPKSESSSFEKWWQRKNAIYHRDQCDIYTRYLFKNMSDCAEAFDPALVKFFASHGNFRILWNFSEVHVVFLAVDVFKMREEWNRRDVDTKQALLNELRNAYVGYGHKKGFTLDGLYNVLVTNLWLINHTLVLEIPNSVFSVNYPHLCRILLPDNYIKVYQEFEKKTIL